MNSQAIIDLGVLIYGIKITLILICVYCSYTDIRYGKIKNWCSYGLIFFGLAVHAVLFLSHAVSLNQILLTLGVGFGLSFLLFWFGFFSAGDSKLLFGILICLIYLRDAQNNIIHIASVLMTNIFLVYILYFLYHFMFKVPYQDKIDTLRELGLLSPKQLLQAYGKFCYRLSYVRGIQFTILWFLTEYLNLKLPFFFSLLLFIGIYLVNLRNFGNYKAKAYLIELPFLLLGIVSSLKVRMPISVLGSRLPKEVEVILAFFVITLVLFIVVRTFQLYFTRVGDKLFVHRCAISDLKEGMIPAERILFNEETKRFEKQSGITAKALSKNVILDVGTHQLKKEKVAQLKQLAADGTFEPFGNAINIQKSIPFAPIIALGVLWTIFFSFSTF